MSTSTAGTAPGPTAAGHPLTALGNGFYASTLGIYIGDAPETGRLVAPQDAPVPWIVHDDLAEAAVVALVVRGAPDGVSALLTAPDLLDLEAVAGLLGDLTGRPVRRVVGGAASSPSRTRRWRSSSVTAQRRCAACWSPWPLVADQPVRNREATGHRHDLACGA